MKKSVVIAIVGLLALVLFLQYLQRRNPAPALPAGQAAPVAEAPAGIPLPAEATAYAAQQPSQETRSSAPIKAPPASVFRAPAEMAGAGPLPTINADFARAPVGYTGKTLNGILSSHGKVWGNATFGPEAFTKEENDALYSLLAQFFSCNAVAYGDLNMCNFLPGALTKKDKYFWSPHYQCLDPASRVLFYAYAAGRFNVNSEAVCRKYLAGDSVEGAKLPPEFCREVAKGFSYICDIAPARDRSRCREAFPADSRNCRTQDCMDNNRLYLSLRDNNISACPDKYMTECGVFSTKSGSVCSLILDNIAGTFAQTEATHEQNMSPEKKKRLEEARKKEEQKIIEDVNKNARKALGKD